MLTMFLTFISTLNEQLIMPIKKGPRSFDIYHYVTPVLANPVPGDVLSLQL